MIGAGYIGIEMAENLHNLGLDVSIIELSDHVIQPLDPDMAAEVHHHILSRSIPLSRKRRDCHQIVGRVMSRLVLSSGKAFMQIWLS